MRTNKLTIGHSTRAERKFHELLKSLHIPFRCKIKINGREVDFLIGDYIIEIDSHKQNVEKNRMLRDLGYNIVHLNNWEINDNLIEWLKNLWQVQDF